MATLTLVPASGVDSALAAREAFEIVAGGYEAALGVEGLSVDDRAFLLRQLHDYDELAERRSLDLLRGGSA